MVGGVLSARGGSIAVGRGSVDQGVVKDNRVIYLIGIILIPNFFKIKNNDTFIQHKIPG